MEKTILDFINAIGFEGMSCLFLTFNLRQLYVDKVVRGISLMSCGFYAIWACWNIFYYWSLNQPLSFYFGILVAILSVWWIILAVLYRMINSDYKIKISRGILSWECPLCHQIPGICWWPGLDEKGNTLKTRRIIPFPQWIFGRVP